MEGPDFLDSNTFRQPRPEGRSHPATPLGQVRPVRSVRSGVMGTVKGSTGVVLISTDWLDAMVDRQGVKIVGSNAQRAPENPRWMGDSA